MGKRKSLAKGGDFKSTFSTVFAGVFGGVAAMAVIGLGCTLLFLVGMYLIRHYNKKGTKLFEELQPMQILGIVLCVLSFLPFLQYFFMGFLANAGASVFEGMTE